MAPICMFDIQGVMIVIFSENFAHLLGEWCQCRIYLHFNSAIPSVLKIVKIFNVLWTVRYQSHNTCFFPKHLQKLNEQVHFFKVKKYEQPYWHYFVFDFEQVFERWIFSQQKFNWSKSTIDTLAKDANMINANNNDWCIYC